MNMPASPIPLDQTREAIAQSPFGDEDWIAVLNFGGQYAHLIAKKLRHLGWNSLALSPNAQPHLLTGAKGLVLSGGPASVNAPNLPLFNAVLLQKVPAVLGLCYGHQLLARIHQGHIEHLAMGEYGATPLTLTPQGSVHPIFKNLPSTLSTWMSHDDTVTQAPAQFNVLARTAFCPVAAMAHKTQQVYGMQFHPEVQDSEGGTQILKNFAILCEAKPSQRLQNPLDSLLADCKAQTGGKNVLMFLSGGVDSTVAFALLTRALGSQRVQGLLLDTGFMRHQEAQQAHRMLHNLGWNVCLKDASALFYQAVEGLVDPQAKRQAVGEAFLKVREQAMVDMALNPAEWLLGQGTLYSDVIESGGEENAHVIKHHHNRVPKLQEWLKAGLVVEPLRTLYKDEVRKLGHLLGLPTEMITRHPFPGPGLSMNVLCANAATPPAEWPAAQRAVSQWLNKKNLVGGALPVRSVGVQGDMRSYAPPAFLWSQSQDWAYLESLSGEITNRLREVNRVVLQLRPRQAPLQLQAFKAYCTPKRVALLRQADHLATKALQRCGWFERIFQLLVILLPVAPKSHATQGECLVLRPIMSEDVMTGRFAPIPWPTLHALSEQLMQLPNVQGVFYDITHKPPATFGWE